MYLDFLSVLIHSDTFTIMTSQSTLLVLWLGCIRHRQTRRNTYLHGHHLPYFIKCFSTNCFVPYEWRKTTALYRKANKFHTTILLFIRHLNSLFAELIMRYSGNRNNTDETITYCTHILNNIILHWCLGRSNFN